MTLRHTMHQPETIEEDTQFNIMESVKFAGDYELDHKERKSSATEDIYDDLETRTNQIFKAVIQPLSPLLCFWSFMVAG